MPNPFPFSQSYAAVSSQLYKLQSSKFKVPSFLINLGTIFKLGTLNFKLAPMFYVVINPKSKSA